MKRSWAGIAAVCLVCVGSSDARAEGTSFSLKGGSKVRGEVLEEKATSVPVATLVAIIRDPSGLDGVSIALALGRVQKEGKSARPLFARAILSVNPDGAVPKDFYTALHGVGDDDGSIEKAMQR